MLQKVNNTWIKGVLDQSLYSIARLELGLSTKPNAVEEVWEVLVQRPDHARQQLPIGTRISKAFDEMGQALLILGAPGAGKTTLLLELAKDLLDRAEKDPNHIIPVVFNLSSWAVRQAQLIDWLGDELSKRYLVPMKHARAWVNKDLILPLLDGLDEVAPEHRSACIDAINAFRAEHGLIPFAVCSRATDYEALTTKLHLQGALVVQPLSREQTKRYLAQAGEPLEGIRMALRDDEVLWELLDTPLMLSIAVLAYHGRSASEVLTNGTLEERKKQLFATYTEAMFKRRSRALLYPHQQTIHWLSWLASAMIRHNQSVFYLEFMQPDWLLSKPSQRIVSLGVILLSGLAGALTALLALTALQGFMFLQEIVSVRHWNEGMEWGELLDVAVFFAIVGGGPAGLLMGVGVLLWTRNSALQPVETVRWDWSAAKARWFYRLLRGGLFGGLFGCLLFTFFILLIDFKIIYTLGIISATMVGAPIGGLVGVLSGALISGDMATRVIPNEGILRSFRNALHFGLLGWLFTVLISMPFVWLNRDQDMFNGTLVLGLFFGAFVGFFFGLQNGGIACFQHLILRILLQCKGFGPWRYTRFLDYAAERIFLRRVGGGYIFVHRMLMEYFATQPSSNTRVEGSE